MPRLSRGSSTQWTRTTARGSIVAQRYSRIWTNLQRRWKAGPTPRISKGPRAFLNFSCTGSADVNCVSTQLLSLIPTRKQSFFRRGSHDCRTGMTISSSIKRWQRCSGHKAGTAHSTSTLSRPSPNTRQRSARWTFSATLRRCASTPASRQVCRALRVTCTGCSRPRPNWIPA